MSTKIEAVKQKQRGAVLTILAVLVFAVRGLTLPTQADEQKHGGTLVFGAENEFAGFDVLKTRGFAICD